MTEPDDVPSLIRRTNVLLTVLARAQVSSAMNTELKEPTKRKLYDLTGGSKSITEISKVVGMSPATISRTWQHWEQCGLLLKEGAKYRRVFD